MTFRGASSGCKVPGSTNFGLLTDEKSGTETRGKFELSLTPMKSNSFPGAFMLPFLQARPSWSVGMSFDSSSHFLEFCSLPVLRNQT